MRCTGRYRGLRSTELRAKGAGKTGWCSPCPELDGKVAQRGWRRGTAARRGPAFAEEGAAGVEVDEGDLEEDPGAKEELLRQLLVAEVAWACWTSAAHSVLRGGAVQAWLLGFGARCRRKMGWGREARARLKREAEPRRAGRRENRLRDPRGVVAARVYWAQERASRRETGSFRVRGCRWGSCPGRLG